MLQRLTVKCKRIIINGLGLEVSLLKPLSKPQLVHFSTIQLVYSPKWVNQKQSNSRQTNYPQTCNANGQIVLALLIFFLRTHLVCHESIREVEFKHICYSYWSPVSSSLSQKWFNKPQAIRIKQQEVCLWLKMTSPLPVRDLHSGWVQKVTG